MKTLGLLMLFLCSLTFGVYSSYKTRTGLSQLRDILDFMCYIKSQIEYFNTPIYDIYKDYNNNDNGLNELISNISLSGWNAAFEKTQKLYLPEAIVQQLMQFGIFLGKSNKEEQLTHCDYYIRLLENEYQKLEQEAPKKTKVSLALGLSAGLMLIILFI